MENNEVVKKVMMEVNTLRQRLKTPGNFLDLLLEDVMPVVFKNVEKAYEQSMELVNQLMQRL
jgi:hypothetical protein